MNTLVIYRIEIKMPLPSPRKGEKQSMFISRCMGNPQTKKDFPEQKQRSAVCFSRFRRSKANFTNKEIEALGTVLPIGNKGGPLGKVPKKKKRKKDKFRLVRDEEVGSSVTGIKKKKKKKKSKVTPY